MATTPDSLPDIPTAASRPQAESCRAPGAARARLWTRLLQPSLFDVLLLAVPLWFFGLAEGGIRLLLVDGDTGWHIRTGEWILANRSFVHHDLFSFSKAGEPWFAWEWLADVILALLHSSGGLQAVALFGLVVGTLFCGVVFRMMVWRGANFWVALPLAFAAFTAATLHLLARPHIFTMLFVPLAAWWIQADLRRPSPWIWLLAPFTILWTNLHGGGLALVSLLGLASAGLAAESVFGQRQWGQALRYAALTAACLAASLVNPYGWKLHAHTLDYLRADHIRNIVGEFRSPSFRGEPMLHYELVLLAACAVSGLLLARRRFVAPFWILFWAHASLQSARHIPLFVAVALPFVAGELQQLWDAWAARGGRRSTLAVLTELAEGFGRDLRRMTPWPAVVLGLAVAGVLPLPRIDDFPGEHFPAGMVRKHGALMQEARILTKDQWADYLIYRLHPRVKVFFDGRSDFYGKDLAMEYLGMMEGRHDWRELLEKYRFDTVLLPPGVPLASLLKISPEWTVVDDDGAAVLFRRKPRTEAALRQRVFAGCSNCPASAPNEIP